MTLNQRKRRDRFQAFKDITDSPIRIDSDDVSIPGEDAAIMNEFMSENRIQCIKMIKSADGRKKFLIASFLNAQDRNFTYNTNSDWMIGNKKNIAEILVNENIYEESEGKLVVKEKEKDEDNIETESRMMNVNGPEESITNMKDNQETEMTPQVLEKREREDQEEDIANYGNREGRFNKQRLVVNS